MLLVILETRSAVAQDANVAYLANLPAGNQLLLDQLAKLGLSKQWTQAGNRTSSRAMTVAFKDPEDQNAWESLDRRFLQGGSNNDWQQYWTQVNWRAPASITMTVRSGQGKSAKLLRLPEPTSTAIKFDDIYPGPLPGDVVLFRVGSTRVAAVWWGNRKFPGRNYETSFFYYSPLPIVSSKQGGSQLNSDVIDFGEDQTAIITSGTMYNSFPPRLTPPLVKSLFPTADPKYLKANSKLFSGAGGYLASPLKSAYGAFFLAPGDWDKTSLSAVSLLRRKDSGSTLVQKVRRAVQKFEAANPSMIGTAVLTSGNRTWQEQLDIILQPRRVANYLNIKRRFLEKFSLTTLPSTRASLTEAQLNWWETEIMLQAGKSPGFPHVGGKAQDVSVADAKFTVANKLRLKQFIEAEGLSILNEKVTANSSGYGVALEQANVFHVYE